MVGLVKGRVVLREDVVLVMVFVGWRRSAGPRCHDCRGGVVTHGVGIIDNSHDGGDVSTRCVLEMVHIH